MFQISAFQVVLLSSALFSWAAGQEFAMTGGECHGGHSGPDCPRQWHVAGGPGWTGQRTNWPVEVICSPSCTDASSPKECSLILAMHGVYSNPGDQKWLMMGHSTDPNHETFIEDDEHGGPYCISFHKSIGEGWEFACGGDDEAHLEAFIHFALDNFPISPDAVNLHGFSSGGIQIHHMMNTGCSIESLISAASSYGSGMTEAPPTTKAAYLIAQGTHDDWVSYDLKKEAPDGITIPSCECTNSGCNGLIYYRMDYFFLQGPRLAGAIARLRGYTGDIWGSLPNPSEHLDLINDNPSRCADRKNACISLHETPNPFNADYDCDDIAFSGSLETDVIEYPIPASSDAGPVTFMKINLHNHDYPDVRRDGDGWWGPTEFFFQLKKFFYENRGRQSYSGTHRVSEVSRCGYNNHVISIYLKMSELTHLLIYSSFVQ